MGPMGPMGPTVRRTARAGTASLLLAGSVLVIGGLAIARADQDPEPASAASSGSGSGSEADTSARTSEHDRPRAPDQAFAVGRRDLMLVDPSRPTPADVNRGQPELPERTIPVVVLYPADGPAAAGIPAQVDAPAAPWRVPLVVFSHGLNASGDLYASLVEPLVRQGYVVALPTFPLTSGRVPMQADFVNQPGDVSFVIDELFALARDRGSWLGGHVDRRRVAVAGHSLGAVTTLGAAYNDCCRDRRIDAVVSISGGPLPYPDGEYDWSGTPLLLVHGAVDQVVPVAGSDAVFDAADGPVWYLRFREADHYGVGLGADGALTVQATIAFLDATLQGRSSALDEVPGAVASSGRADWRTRPDPSSAG